MQPFTFWDRWLLLASGAMVLVGLLLAFFPDGPLWAYHTEALAGALFGGVLPEEAAVVRRFLMGPLGGTIAGYFVLQAFIVLGPFRRREPWAWWAITGALVLWFVVDSSMSLLHGAAFNVWMVNVGTLVLVGLPLALTAPAFLGRGSAAGGT